MISNYDFKILETKNIMKKRHIIHTIIVKTVQILQVRFFK
jgi:hypothetical protein